MMMCGLRKGVHMDPPCLGVNGDHFTAKGSTQRSWREGESGILVLGGSIMGSGECTELLTWEENVRFGRRRNEVHKHDSRWEIEEAFGSP